jgi:hypothetical protein
MRILLLCLTLLVAAPSFAATQWQHYQNSRFGYALDVPPDFLGQGESQNGDGQVFVAGNGTRVLYVWGGYVAEESFEAAMTTAMDYASDDGWRLQYQRVTPDWASYSGLRNGIMLYSRVIALCAGTQFAAFALEYPERDVRAMEPVIERLAGSLAATGSGYECPVARTRSRPAPSRQPGTGA